MPGVKGLKKRTYKVSEKACAARAQNAKLSHKKSKHLADLYEQKCREMEEQGIEITDSEVSESEEEVLEKPVLKRQTANDIRVDLEELKALREQVSKVYGVVEHLKSRKDTKDASKKQKAATSQQVTSNDEPKKNNAQMTDIMRRLMFG